VNIVPINYERQGVSNLSKTPAQNDESPSLPNFSDSTDLSRTVFRGRINALLLFAVIALCAVAAYALPPTIQAGDAGEFSTVLLGGGVPHPPGYPLMRLLGTVSRLLYKMGFEPSIAAALPNALAAIGAWIVALMFVNWKNTAPLQWMTRALLLLAFSSAGLFLGHLYDCEVWGLHLLLSLATAMACARQLDLRLCALLWGFALGQHLTALFLAPLIFTRLLGSCEQPQATKEPTTKSEMWVFARRFFQSSALFAAIAASICIALYATIFGQSNGAWTWGNLDSFAGWVHHVLRADYGTLSLGLRSEKPPILLLLERHFASLAEVFSLSLTSNAIIGVFVFLFAAWGIAGRSLNLDRRTIWGYRLTLFISGPLFAALGNFDPRADTAAWIMERFDILPAALAIPGLVAGIELIFDFDRRRSLRVIVSMICATALTSIGWSERAMSRSSADRSVEVYARDLVATPPLDQTSVIFGSDDHRSFAQLYVREILQLAPHVIFIDAGLLPYDWYRLHLQTRWPDLPVDDRPVKMINAMLADPKWSKRPLYLANIFSRPASQIRRVPEGIAWRVVAPGADRTPEFSDEALADRHLQAFSRLRGQPGDFAGIVDPSAAKHHPWSIDLWQPYIETTTALVAHLRARGKHQLAESIIFAVKARLVANESASEAER
jgi:hypothetical protein